jgi:hypothetical protein
LRKIWKNAFMLNSFQKSNSVGGGVIAVFIRGLTAILGTEIKRWQHVMVE